jgi:hypothetical protein
MDVELLTVKLAAAAVPKVTVMASVKLVPVMVTEVPPAVVPEVGLKEVTVVVVVGDVVVVVGDVVVVVGDVVVVVGDVVVVVGDVVVVPVDETETSAPTAEVVRAGEIMPLGATALETSGSKATRLPSEVVW